MKLFVDHKQGNDTVAALEKIITKEEINYAVITKLFIISSKKGPI